MQHKELNKSVVGEFAESRGVQTQQTHHVQMASEIGVHKSGRDSDKVRDTRISNPKQEANNDEAFDRALKQSVAQIDSKPGGSIVLHTIVQKVKELTPEERGVIRTSVGSDGDEMTYDPPAGSDFNDLVRYNDDGKPYIDVNKLIYSPKNKRKLEGKEKLRWYFADYFFIITSFLSLISSMYILAIGLQASTWNPSVDAVTHADPDPDFAEYTKGGILRLYKRVLPSDIGMLLLSLCAVNAVNVAIGIVGAISGYKYLLLQHTMLDIVLFLIYLSISIFVLSTGTCDEGDILGFQEGFEYLIRAYSGKKEYNEAGDEQYYATTLLDDIQVSMQCCGASNWTDFLSSRVTFLNYDFESRKTFDKTEVHQVFPFSCCKSWWVRNIHCATNVHVWTYPFPNTTEAKNTSRLELKRFRERIQEVGCVPKMWLSCKRLLFALGQGFFMFVILNLILVCIKCFATHLLLRSLNVIVRKMQEEEGTKMKKRGFKSTSSSDEEVAKKHDDKSNGDGKSDARSSLSYGMRGIEDLKSQLALPTEDEIRFIKSRTPFAQFELKMRHTNIGRLMKKARRSATAKVPQDELSTHKVITPVEARRMSIAMPTPSQEIQPSRTQRKSIIVTGISKKDKWRSREKSIYTDAEQDILLVRLLEEKKEAERNKMEQSSSTGKDGHPGSATRARSLVEILAPQHVKKHHRSKPKTEISHPDENVGDGEIAPTDPTKNKLSTDSITMVNETERAPVHVVKSKPVVIDHQSEPESEELFQPPSQYEVVDEVTPAKVKHRHRYLKRSSRHRQEKPTEPIQEDRQVVKAERRRTETAIPRRSRDHDGYQQTPPGKKKTSKKTERRRTETIIPQSRFVPPHDFHYQDGYQEPTTDDSLEHDPHRITRKVTKKRVKKNSPLRSSKDTTTDTSGDEARTSYTNDKAKWKMNKKMIKKRIRVKKVKKQPLSDDHAAKHDKLWS